jgi:hypothetical protein
MPGVCSVTPVQFTYIVYKYLTEKSDTTVGQIMSFNGGYNPSDHSDVEATWITAPMGCVNLGLNATEVL